MAVNQRTDVRSGGTRIFKRKVIIERVLTDREVSGKSIQDTWGTGDGSKKGAIVSVFDDGVDNGRVHGHGSRGSFRNSHSRAWSESSRENDSLNSVQNSASSSDIGFDDLDTIDHYVGSIKHNAQHVPSQSFELDASSGNNSSSIVFTLYNVSGKNTGDFRLVQSGNDVSSVGESSILWPKNS